MRQLDTVEPAPRASADGAGPGHQADAQQSPYGVQGKGGAGGNQGRPDGAELASAVEGRVFFAIVGKKIVLPSLPAVSLQLSPPDRLGCHQKSGIASRGARTPSGSDGLSLAQLLPGRELLAFICFLVTSATAREAWPTVTSWTEAHSVVLSGSEDSIRSHPFSCSLGSFSFRKVNAGKMWQSTSGARPLDKNSAGPESDAKFPRGSVYETLPRTCRPS